MKIRFIYREYADCNLIASVHNHRMNIHRDMTRRGALEIIFVKIE